MNCWLRLWQTCDNKDVPIFTKWMVIQALYLCGRQHEGVNGLFWSISLVFFKATKVEAVLCHVNTGYEQRLCELKRVKVVQLIYCSVLGHFEVELTHPKLISQTWVKLPTVKRLFWVSFCPCVYFVDRATCYYWSLCFAYCCKQSLICTCHLVNGFW